MTKNNDIVSVSTPNTGKFDNVSQSLCPLCGEEMTANCNNGGCS